MVGIPSRPPPTVQHPEKFSPEFNDFIAKCLVKDPSARPTAAELLKHPFLAIGDATLIDLVKEPPKRYSTYIRREISWVLISLSLSLSLSLSCVDTGV